MPDRDIATFKRIVHVHFGLARGRAKDGRFALPDEDEAAFQLLRNVALTDETTQAALRAKTETGDKLGDADIDLILSFGGSLDTSKLSRMVKGLRQGGLLDPPWRKGEKLNPPQPFRIATDVWTAYEEAIEAKSPASPGTATAGHSAKVRALSDVLAKCGLGLRPNWKRLLHSQVKNGLSMDDAFVIDRYTTNNHPDGLEQPHCAFGIAAEASSPWRALIPDYEIRRSERLGFLKTKWNLKEDEDPFIRQRYWMTTRGRLSSDGGEPRFVLSQGFDYLDDLVIRRSQASMSTGDLGQRYEGDGLGFDTDLFGPVSTEIAVVTKATEGHPARLLILQRKEVDNYPSHFMVSIGEQMNAKEYQYRGKPVTKDLTPFDAVRRGLVEELGLNPQEADQSDIRLTGLLRHCRFAYVSFTGLVRLPVNSFNLLPRLHNTSDHEILPPDTIEELEQQWPVFGAENAQSLPESLRMLFGRRQFMKGVEPGGDCGEDCRRSHYSGTARTVALLALVAEYGEGNVAATLEAVVKEA